MLREEPEVATELLSLFVTETDRQLKALGESIRNPDRIPARKLFHSLKGSCSQMGAEDCARACARLEAEVLTAPYEDLQRGLDELQEHCARVQAAIGAVTPLHS